MITAEQRAHFETFGFLVMRQVFTPDEIAVMTREANEIMDEERGGRPFDGEKRQFVQPFFERKPFRWRRSTPSLATESRDRNRCMSF